VKGRPSGLVRVMFLIVPFGVIWLLLDSSEHLPDEALIKRFYRYEKDFETLAQMAAEDSKVTRIANDFTWLENNAAWPRPGSELGFSRERWENYRRLFNKLGIKGGISRKGHPETIFLLSSTTGLATGGDEKGYAYCGHEPTPLVDSLDSIPIEVKSLQQVYKRVKGNWYLYYVWDD